MVAKPGLPAHAAGYRLDMSGDEELVVIFGALHLVALLLGVVMFVMFARSDRPEGRQDGDEDEGGGGGSDRISDSPKTSPSGGIPLPDAEPAPVRLRGPERLRDLLPRPERRRVVEPGRARPRVPSR
jgi:hypothetical protein